jgi:hypothetical protein
MRRPPWRRALCNRGRRGNQGEHGEAEANARHTFSIGRGAARHKTHLGYSYAASASSSAGS